MAEKSKVVHRLLNAVLRFLGIDTKKVFKTPATTKPLPSKLAIGTKAPQPKAMGAAPFAKPVRPPKMALSVRKKKRKHKPQARSAPKPVRAKKVTATKTTRKKKLVKAKSKARVHRTKSHARKKQKTGKGKTIIQLGPHSRVAVGALSGQSGVSAHKQRSWQELSEEIAVQKEALKRLEHDLYKHRISQEDYRHKAAEIHAKIHELEARQQILKQKEKRGVWKKREKTEPVDSSFRPKKPVHEEALQPPRDASPQTAPPVMPEVPPTEPLPKATAPAPPPRTVTLRSASLEKPVVPSKPVRRMPAPRVVVRKKTVAKPPKVPEPQKVRYEVKKEKATRNLEQELEDARFAASVGKEQERLEIERLKRQIEKKFEGKVDPEKLDKLNRNLENVLQSHLIGKEEVEKGIARIEANRVLDGFMKLMELLEAQRMERPRPVQVIPAELKEFAGKKKKERFAVSQKELESKELITDYDKILAAVRKKGKMSLKELGKELEMNKKNLKEALDVLESNSLIKLEYPAFGSARVVDPHWRKGGNK